MHIDSGKWGLVKGLTLNADQGTCAAIVTQADSAPSSEDCMEMGKTND